VIPRLTRPTIPAPAWAGSPTEVVYRAIQGLAFALVLVLIAALLHMGDAPYIAFAFAGGFIMHAMTRPGWKYMGWAAVLGGGFGAIYLLHRGSIGAYPGAVLGIPGGFLGMGSLLVAATGWCWAPAADRRVHLERLFEVGTIPVLCVFSLMAVDIAAEFTPVTYDRLLLAYDAKFGGPPSWVIGRVLRAHPWLFNACAYVYNSLPFGLAACLALQLVDRQRNARILVDLRKVAILLGVAGFVLYQVCPAAGPVYLFASTFPFQIPDLTGWAVHPAQLTAVPRNAMPSLHVGWTMLLAWNLRRRNWWIRIAGILYLTFTALATLGSGEHYLVDLMVALPLALAIQAACTELRCRERTQALAAGSIITFAWLLAFRTGAALAVPGGAAAWVLAAASVVVPAMLAVRLGRAEARG
jgi:hypothetical protein